MIPRTFEFFLLLGEKYLRNESRGPHQKLRGFNLTLSISKQAGLEKGAIPPTLPSRRNNAAAGPHKPLHVPYEYKAFLWRV